MALTVEEMCKGLARIEWKTEFECPGCADGTFELKRFHPSISYAIAYYSGYNFYSKIETPTAWTELYLRRITSPAELFDQDAELLEADYGHKPSAVWASINGGEKSLLKESSSFYETLESEKFDFDYYPADTSGDSTVCEPTQLTITLWIEFDSLDDGEKNVLRKMSDMFVNQVQCDVQFELDDELIGGHVSILTVTSPVFAAMFQELPPCESLVIKIEDVQKDVFKELLYYIYTGRLGTPLNEETAKQLFAAGKTYDVADLMGKCVDYLSHSIRMANAIDLVSWAHRHSIDSLKESALSFIGHHGQEISQLGDWEKLMHNYPDLCVIVTRRIIERASTSIKYRITADQDFFDDS